MERDCVERRLLLTSETEIGVRGVNVLPTKTKQPRMQTKSFKETKMWEGKGRKIKCYDKKKKKKSKKELKAK
jgi:hypothetical protein